MRQRQGSAHLPGRGSVMTVTQLGGGVPTYSEPRTPILTPTYLPIRSSGPARAAVTIVRSLLARSNFDQFDAIRRKTRQDSRRLAFTDPEGPEFHCQPAYYELVPAKFNIT